MVTYLLLGEILHNNRPVFLNLTQMRFPLTAIISILHRISGVLLFLALPWLLYLLHALIASPFSYATLLPLPALSKFILWIVLSALAYHLLAGLRHIFMDMGYAESFAAATKSAVVLLFLAALVAIYLGVLLW